MDESTREMESVGPIRKRFASTTLVAACLLLVGASSASASDFIQPPTSPETVGQFPAGVATGDVDLDGDVDTVTANFNSTFITTNLNNGFGDFTAVNTNVDFTTGIDLALGKFDADNIPDLAFLIQGNAAGGQAGIVEILKGNGDGTFTNPFNAMTFLFTPAGAGGITGIRPTQLAVGNFNADAISDVAVVNSQQTASTTQGTVSIFLGNAAANDTFAGTPGTFNAVTASQTIATGFNSADIAATTLDAGATTDLVVTNALGNAVTPTASGSGSLTILLGSGTGTFAAGTPVAAFLPLYLVAAPFNAGATNDIVTTVFSANPATAGASIFFPGNGNGTFGTAVAIANGAAGQSGQPQQIVERDFDGDGDRDFATANLGTDNVSVLVNPGNAAFTPAPTSPEPVGDGPIALAAGDFDNSGFPDLAVANFGTISPSTPGTTESILLNRQNANLSVTKTDSADPVHVTDSFSYNLAVSNAGPSAATLVSVTDTLPAQVSYNDGASDSRCNETSPGVVTCTTPQLSNGALTSFNINVTANTPAAAANNSATVASAIQTDSTPANNTDSETTEIRAAADLSVTKADSADPIHVGETVQYKVDFANAGPSGATSVVVTDTLPAELTYVDGTSDPRCNAGVGNTVVCNIPTLASGAGDTVTIDATGNAPAAPATDSVSIDAAEDDLVPGNNTDTEDTTILAAADLAIDKSDDADPVHVGDDITYTLDVDNNGPSGATNVVVTDDLPAEVTYDDTASDVRCDEPVAGSGNVECDLGAIADGGSDSVDIVASADAPAAPATDSASVDADQDDLVPANNTATEDTTIRASADLSVDKTDSADPVHVGDQFSYSLDIANAGPSDATKIVVSDTLPAEVSYVDADSDPRCDETSPGVVECTSDLLIAGGTDSFEVAVTADTPAAAALNNVTIDGDEDDLVPANNSGDELTEIRAAAGLSIGKSDSADPVNVGDDFTYTLEVDNAGPSDAANTMVTDDLPDEVSYDDAGSDVRCDETATPGVIECDLDTLASGASDSVVIAVTADAPANPATNTATVDSDVDDADLSDNTDTEETVILSADLSIDKTDTGSDPVIVGNDITYTLAVTNDGPNDATNVEVTDDLPAGTTFNAGASDPGCGEAAGTVTCDYGTIVEDATNQVTLVLGTTTAAVPQVSNTAEVDSDVFDPDTGNNSDTETTTVSPAADLAITKADTGSDPVAAGGDITYTLSVTNNGPSSATDVTATDVLPAGLSFDAAASDPDCSAGGGTVTCEYGTITSGATNSVTLVVNTDGDAVPSVSNTATVDSDEIDPVSGNNSDTEMTTVNAAADVSISKTDLGPVAVGDEIVYTLAATNNGPSNATDVSATDVLPASLTFNGPASDVPCTAVGQTVTCDFGDVADGATEDLRVVATSSAASAPQVTNTATVDANEPDAVAANNTDSVTTQVVAPTEPPGGSGPSGGGGTGGTGALGAQAAAVDTKIDRAPRKVKRRKRAVFLFSSALAGARFECSIDGGAFAACGSPFAQRAKRLRLGTHSFQVRAIGADGVADGTPAVATFKVRR